MADPENPLRVLVVEDEWPARNYLVELLHASNLAAVVGAVADPEAAMEALAPDAPPLDVVFADIHLVGSERDDAGLELVRKVARKPGAPTFVLATAFKEHAIEAFDLGVADYLLKPFTEERVDQCLRRLQARRTVRAPQAPARIVARRRKGLVFLRPDEVWAFEAADRLTFVHTRHGKFDLDLSLSAIEAAFGGAGRGLLRVHRNWVVNLDHVKELLRDGGDSEIFVGEGLDEQAGAGIRVPVARERAQAVRDSLLSDATGLRR
ncbi:MAG: response regulator transcription factor [Myxococcales bacterium]|nr:response regulator transcription factor [Myxococcales bacterium]